LVCPNNEVPSSPLGVRQNESIHQKLESHQASKGNPDSQQTLEHPKENVARCPLPDELDTSVPNLKHLGGSKSDDWNLLLCNQVLSAAWYRRNDTSEEKAKQHTAQLAFLAGVNPQDVLEGMMAAQLFASHAASMECYRRAMLPEQTAEGRQTNLAQAAKLTRANAAQMEALAKHRNKGRQKITIEHVHVYAGGQAIVGNVAPGGSAKIVRFNPMQLPMHKAPRCGAKTRSAKPCQSPAMVNGRCRMHGGPSPGAPKGNQNALKHGRYSTFSVLERRRFAALISEMRETAAFCR
jgi:hypothetical protein